MFKKPCLKFHNLQFWWRFPSLIGVSSFSEKQISKTLVPFKTFTPSHKLQETSHEPNKIAFWVEVNVLQKKRIPWNLKVQKVVVIVFMGRREMSYDETTSSWKLFVCFWKRSVNTLFKRPQETFYRPFYQRCLGTPVHGG